MALVFLGQSTCPLCGKTLQVDEAITGLPPLAAREHPLYQYFDQGFHLQCFDNWDKREEALALLEEDKRAFINSAYFAAMVAKYSKPQWLNE